jgi:hypothetical protein
MGLLDKLLRRGSRDVGPRRENLVVLYARVPDGVTEDDGLRLRDLFNSANAIGWWFLNPGSFHAYFSADDSGRAHASALANRLAEAKRIFRTLAELKVATAEGPLLVSRRMGGGFESMPLGETINRAMRLAHEQ